MNKREINRAFGPKAPLVPISFKVKVLTDWENRTPDVWNNKRAIGVAVHRAKTILEYAERHKASANHRVSIEHFGNEAFIQISNKMAVA